MDLKQLQSEVREWSERNFGLVPYWMPLMGVSEEVGELNHALLKQEQGIRGSWGNHEEMAKDAVGDIIVFLADLCCRRGWDLAEIVDSVWSEVKQRDWTKDKANG